jgi:uncharacterized protein YeeX (DUF496 family)
MNYTLRSLDLQHYYSIDVDTLKMIDKYLVRNKKYSKDLRKIPKELLPMSIRIQLTLPHLPFYVRQYLLFSDYLTDEQNYRLSDYLLKNNKERIGKRELVDLFKGRSVL